MNDAARYEGADELSRPVANNAAPTEATEEGLSESYGRIDVTPAYVDGDE